MKKALGHIRVLDQHAAPTLGEHTDEVLGGLGYDAARIAALRKDGVL